MIKVLTLNVGQLKFPLGKGKRNNRALMLANILNKEENPYDVICFQELFRGNAQDILVRWLIDKYPYYRVDRSRGKYLIGANSGLAIFSRHPIIRDIKHQFTVWGGVENFAKKSVWGVEIAVEETKTYIFTTHLQTGLSGTPCICKLIDRNKLTSTELKTQQLEEIKNVMKEFVGEGDNVLLMGDFNIKDTSDLYQTMHEKFSSVRIMDTFATEESDLQSTAIGEDKRIDYIWSDGAGDSIIVDDFRSTPEITDHRGVVGFV